MSYGDAVELGLQCIVRRQSDLEARPASLRHRPASQPESQVVHARFLNPAVSCHCACVGGGQASISVAVTTCFLGRFVPALGGLLSVFEEGVSVSGLAWACDVVRALSVSFRPRSRWLAASAAQSRSWGLALGSCDVFEVLP